MTGMEWGEVQEVYLLCPPSPARGEGAGIGDDTPHARRLSRAAFAPPLLRRGQIAALRDALAQYPPPPPRLRPPSTQPPMTAAPETRAPAGPRPP